MTKASTVFLDAINPINIYYYIEGTRKDFGTKFTILLISNYFAIKGVLFKFIETVQHPYYQLGGWSSSETQNATAVSKISWSTKGWAGILADAFPILGYEKGSWMFIYTFVGTVCLVVLGVFEMNSTNIATVIPTMLFFFVNITVAYNDLLMEGKYAELMKDNPKNRGNVISFTYFMVTFGGAIPTFFIGTLADADQMRTTFYIMIPFTVQPCIFLLFGCMIRDKADKKRNNRIDFTKIKLQGRIFVCAFLMGLISVGTAIVGIVGNEFHSFVYNIAGGIVMGIFLYVALPAIIANILVYVFCIMLLYLNISSHLEYYYTDACVANGPHFTYTYYKTYVGFAGIVAQLIGIWLFQAIFCRYKYRPMFWVTTIIRVLASIFDIIIIKRWNIQFGIPDQYFYMIGSGIIYQAAYQMDYMPMALMCAKACPAKVETAVFAIAAGYGNFGDILSRFIGNYMAQVFNVNISSQEGICNHENLIYLVIIGHLITPLISVPLTFFLIPNKYVHENLADPAFQKSKHYYIDPTVPIYSTQEKV